MAPALSAENQHQQLSRGTSPLVGTSDEVVAGEYDLSRFVASATDDLVAARALDALEPRGHALSDFRGALTQDDLYTLLAFAKRIALRVLRGSPEQLASGWAAVGLVDLDRVDWRDAAVAAGLLAHAATRTGTAPRPSLESALAIAEPGMAKLLKQYSKPGEDGLSVGGYREIATPGGPALVKDYGQPYDPTLDLLAVGHSVVNVVEGDGYRITGITTGTEIASVWLPSEDAQKVTQARQGIPACLSISAAPRGGDTAAAVPEQIFLTYVAECATPEDADLLARAAKRPPTLDVAALAVCHDRLCVELIARSTVKGVCALESASSIERFRESLAHALSTQIGGGGPSA